MSMQLDEYYAQRESKKKMAPYSSEDDTWTPNVWSDDETFEPQQPLKRSGIREYVGGERVSMQAGNYVRVISSADNKDFPIGTLCLILPYDRLGAERGGRSDYPDTKNERHIESIGTGKRMWIDIYNIDEALAPSELESWWDGKKWH